MSSYALPEEHIQEAGRPFTGAEFLASLKDGREVYYAGELVEDVTTHPAFKNAAASVAAMYDALHDPATKDKLCWATDTGNGGYTHKFFRYATSPEELLEQREAIAEWARMSYGWMGRTADYKAAFGATLGANPDFYEDYADNARTWYKRIQENCLYLNHAIVNPPIDRNKPSDTVKDVYVHVTKEIDEGIYVKGAKVVATNSALTHYNFIGQTAAQEIGDDPDFALLFITPMNAQGVKLISRVSYEKNATDTAAPFDYPLSSRFDENDAILILDNVFIPWKDVLIYKNKQKLMQWGFAAGFGRLYPLQACTRFAVKLDFLAGLLEQVLECTGAVEFRNVAAELGEVVAWRNLFWSISDHMCLAAQEWQSGAYLPPAESAFNYRTFAPMAYDKIFHIIKTTAASGLIYLPGSTKDLDNQELNDLLAVYCRGSYDISHLDRIKIMKLMWDAIGSEFGGRHHLYELNYAGTADAVRIQCLGAARASGTMQKMRELSNKCMADYDTQGWVNEIYK